MDGRTIEKCSVAEDGVCAMHGVEIERRKTDRRDIDAVKREIEENNKHIGALLTFKNIAIGVSMLGMMVLTGGYLYTYSHIQTAEIKYGAYDLDIRSLDGRINSLSTRLAVVDERYMALTTQMATLNDRLGRLISIINRDAGELTNAKGSSK